VFKVLKVSEVFKDYRELTAYRVLRDSLEHRLSRVPRVSKGSRVLMDLRDTREHRV